MKEPPVDREQLIAEIKAVASWKEELIEKNNEVQKSQVPHFQTYEEFIKKYDSEGCGGCLFSFLYFAFFIYAYYKTNLFPDGFFIGILIFIAAIVLLFVLAVVFNGFIAKNEMKMAEENKDRWLKEYQVKKDKYDKDNKEKREQYFHNLSIFEAVRQKKPDTFIPEQYQEPHILRMLVGYIENYRANTFAEAINLYHQEQHNREVDEKVDNAVKAAERAAESADRAASAASSAAWEASRK